MKIINGREVLIAAHRGVAGGNIPGNTSVAFEIALAQGADIIELDVAKNAEGELFVFHPKIEPVHLQSEKLIADMTTEEVLNQRFVNRDLAFTQYGVEYFSDVMKNLKGRCLVNVDKFWMAPKEISEAIRELGMEKDVIIKTSPKPEFLELVEKYAWDMPYLPILRETDDCFDTVRKMKINCIGAEVCFSTEDAQVASDEFIEKMHNEGLKLWVNTIIYNYKKVLSAGHNDDISLAGNPDDGWGWILNKGFDIIQTDWPVMLNRYMEKF